MGEQYKHPYSSTNEMVRTRLVLLLMDTCWPALLTGESRAPFPYLLDTLPPSVVYMEPDSARIDTRSIVIGANNYSQTIH